MVETFGLKQPPSAAAIVHPGFLPPKARRLSQA